MIGASLLLCNLSATNFVGMTGNIYRFNMTEIGWETPCAIALLIVAVILLPRYLRRGALRRFQTLEERYDATVKKWVSVLFIICYVCNTLPICLYAGAITLNQIFDIPGLFGLTYSQGVWAMVLLIGAIGIIYAPVWRTESNCHGRYFKWYPACHWRPDGSDFRFAGVGSWQHWRCDAYYSDCGTGKAQCNWYESDILPFSTMFTGLMPVLIYYWGMDQAIMQRPLSEQKSEEGQKGVLFAGFLKLLSSALS